MKVGEPYGWLDGERVTDSQLRALRDSVYGQVTSDNNWAACGPHWWRLENYRWLKAHDPARKAEVAA